MNKDYNYYLSAALKFTRNKEDAEDVLQQTFLQTLSNNSIITHKDTYFYKALYNSSVIYSQKKRRAQRFNTLESGFEAEVVYYSSSEIDYDTLNELRFAIEKLSIKQKEVINHLLTGKTLMEFNGNYNTAKEHYRVALKNLKVLLNGDENDRFK